MCVRGGGMLGVRARHMESVLTNDRSLSKCFEIFGFHRVKDLIDTVVCFFQMYSAQRSWRVHCRRAHSLQRAS